MRPIDPRLEELLDEPVVRALRQVAGDTPSHLVGGVVRDRLLGIAGHDYDAVVAGGGLGIGQRLAASLPARLVRLGGKAFAAYRLVGEGFTLDIWDRQDQSLRDDLARRDLTINAIALAVGDRRIVDPFAGLGDLEQRRLRATTGGVFADDPLRVLRLVRLALRLPGFTADPASLELARAASGGLVRIAVERVRDELGKVLRSPRLVPGLGMLIDLEVYPGLLLGRPGEPGGGGRAVRLLRRLEPALTRLSELPAVPHGRLEVAGPRLATLFAGLEPASDGVAAALERYRAAGYLTAREAARCGRLIGCREVPDSTAAARWFLHSWGEDWPAAAAMLAIADDPAGPGDAWRSLVERLVELARAEAAAIFDPPPLLDGAQIGRLLEISPGPAVGVAVERLRRAQIEGRVRDRADAEALVRSSASDAG